MDSNKENTSTVKSIERALKILESFRNSTPEMGLMDIAEKVGLTKGTTHRIISTLCSANYIAQDCKAGKYRLGPKVFELGCIAQNHMELYRVAKPFLYKLREKTNETVHLVIAVSEEVLYIDKVDSLEPIRMNSFIGQRLPMYCTGVGKVLLAHKSREHRYKIYKDKGLRSLTPNTITSVEKMEAELEKIKTKGYAFDDEEGQSGLKCIASPIFDYQGNVISAISVSGPSYRMGAEKIEVIVGDILEVSKEISFAMGYRS